MVALRNTPPFVRVSLLLLILSIQGPLLVSNWGDGGRYDTASACNFLLACQQEGAQDIILAENHQIYEYQSKGKLKAEEMPYTLDACLRRLQGIESAFIVFPLQRGVPLGFRGEDYKVWLKRNCRLLRSFSSRRFDFMCYEVAVYRYERASGSEREKRIS
jgi:hypothetical protein